jgi:hypothetical protein
MEKLRLVASSPFKSFRLRSHAMVLLISCTINAKSTQAQKITAETFTPGEITGIFTNFDTTLVGSMGLMCEGSTGLYGRSFKSNGSGITGEAFGVQGRGVNAYASGLVGFAVYGSATGNSGIGVYGQTTGTFGSGVYGTTLGTFGAGVYGVGQSFGTIGKAFGDNGIGVDSYGKYIGVNGLGGSFDFYASGYNNVDYGTASSRRWKKEIYNIDHPLEKIANLRGVYFTWDEAHGGQHDLGFIAEEVGTVLPEIVAYEENGTDAIGMDYSKLTPLLVEAVNALNQKYESRVLEQAQEIETLKKDLSQLRALLISNKPDSMKLHQFAPLTGSFLIL